MNPTVSSVTPGLSILSYRTELFKAGLLSLTVTSPVAKGEGMLSSLLFSVLRRGCVRYPTLDALNRRLDYLYGTDLSLRNFSRGDRLLSGIALDLLDPSYLPTGEEGLLREALEVVRELLFFPLLDGEGNLLSRYVESEKQQLCDRIRARRSNPAAYAVHRCRELLFSEDPTGALYTVTEEEVMAVTPAALTAFYHRYLSSMHLQAFYVGPREGEEILSVLEEIFGDLVKTPRATLPPTAFVRAKERLSSLPRITIHAPDYPGSVLLFSAEGIPSEALAGELGRRGICVRGGYHCAALGHATIGTPPDGAVRASFGMFNTAADVDRLTGVLSDLLS